MQYTEKGRLGIRNEPLTQDNLSRITSGEDGGEGEWPGVELVADMLQAGQPLRVRLFVQGETP